MNNSSLTCWVQFFDKDDFKTNHHYGTFLGPNDVETLDGKNWPNTSNNMNTDYSSLKTGPNTWLKVWKSPAFSGDYYVYPPNSSIPALKHADKGLDGNNHPVDVGSGNSKNFENCIRSYKISDSNSF